MPGKAGRPIPPRPYKKKNRGAETVNWWKKKQSDGFSKPRQTGLKSQGLKKGNEKITHKKEISQQPSLEFLKQEL